MAQFGSSEEAGSIDPLRKYVHDVESGSARNIVFERRPGVIKKEFGEDFDVPFDDDFWKEKFDFSRILSIGTLRV